ncbi:G-type lectin S-receptor-like serine/threonine-protein kinase At1g11330 [Cornus florida]|uniref:G-type lectin S-receptor-like serine/threonine-protein kinase At1g11330 n=1 Tax=Cornus florida TaxID=4283 RepID=UPI0028983CB1|nr:G-type lectin S-receptor-like serine/threonine-protein kinase At1g11330 [Cornus florida]
MHGSVLTPYATNKKTSPPSVFINKKHSNRVIGLAMVCTRLMTLLLIFYCSCTIEFSTAIDTITSTQLINDPEAIVSNGTATFKLGFFSPVNSTNRYVGIWYNHISAKAVVWVANREKPLNDSSGTLTISEDGNFVVLDGQKQIVWSSDVPNSSANSSALLLDSRNLILQDDSNGNIIWESFEHPSDSFLEGMKISTKKFTDKKTQLTSWKSPSDPSNGRFTLGINAQNILEVYIWNGSHPYWRAGPWNGQVFIGIPEMISLYISRYDVVEDKEGNVYISYSYAKESPLLYMTLSSDGYLIEKNKSWENLWWAPDTECDVYGKCGPFGSCNVHGSPICTCLRGFDPKDMEEWSRGNWSSGCERRRQLQRERNNSDGGEMGKDDGFLKLKTVKVPAFAELSLAAQDNCESQCLKNCSCIAYTYCSGIGCMQWSGDLIDIQEFSYGGSDLYIRVAYSELGNKKRSTKVVITIAVLIGSLTIAICIYLSWRWMARPPGRKNKLEKLLFKRGGVNLDCSNESILGKNLNRIDLEELPLFSFQKLAIATDNFDVANKLGQGGFGPVYKGKLSSGQDIAVKRLSKFSGQGLEEFMNEVLAISQLQHRNLVRLLGCCEEGEEKMLIHEYMPNKSLDGFLFDPIKQKLLDWRKRSNIIEGIAQGLLYLHRDSRLKIIHRDLKTSNVLLDVNLNPKISDFGIAKIFGDNQDQANTRRVVGTYGYMAPEYAMRGRFSEKSDVFSFGVLLLEIVSGQKNSNFYHDKHSLSLLGFVSSLELLPQLLHIVPFNFSNFNISWLCYYVQAWKLWNENRIEMLIDPTISDPCFYVEILRHIHVGLLCVQDLATDRPTMSTVLFMLSSEIANLPTPKQPAFTEMLGLSNKRSSQQTRRKFSVNNVTLTTIDGR